MRRTLRQLSAALAAAAFVALPIAASAAGGHSGAYHWSGGGGHWNGGGGHWNGGHWYGGWHGYYYPGWGVTVGLGFGAPWYYPYYYPYYPYYSYYPGYAVSTQGYPVAATPGDTVVSNAPSAPEPVVYPRNGQSAEQTEADRRDCDRWAMSQPRAMADASVFQRATIACLEGRGYTVR